jgi:hypothetical protein
MLDHILTTLFGNYLETLGQELEHQADRDLQNSTCQDTMNSEDIAQSREQFEVFEDHFIRPLLDLSSPSSLWMGPILNSFPALSFFHSVSIFNLPTSLLFPIFSSDPRPLLSFFPDLPLLLLSLPPNHPTPLLTYSPQSSSDWIPIIARTHVMLNDFFL